MRVTRRAWTSVIAVAAILGGLSSVSGETGTVQSCGSSGTYQVCLIAPEGPLSGDVPISATVSPTTGIGNLVFAWGPTETTTADLVRDFEAPFEFVWPTRKYLDATQYLNVRVVTTSATTGSPVHLRLTLSNGNATTIHNNPSDWGSVFSPKLPESGDPVTAAVGDGASGRRLSDQLVDSIKAQDPSLLLYLGDVYERGTYAENFNFYGLASFDDDAVGTGTRWGSMASYTRPTLGNHEGHYIEAWRDYWHGLPMYSSFDFGGVHYLALNSECSRPQVGGCAVGSPQYEFVRRDLAANTLSCVVAYWHRPVLSAFPETTAMKPIWALLAAGGGDLVINGHAHDMQQYAPMNANLETGKPDSHMVELISGAGGHKFAKAVNTDPRHVWQLQSVAGAVYVTAVGGSTGQASRLDWVFRGTDGKAVAPAGGFGSVDCGGAADTTAPTKPGKPGGISNTPGSIELSWTASSDAETTTLTYRVYRDGGATPVGTVTSGTSTKTVTYTDTGLDPGSTHTYEVEAVDASNNASARSETSDPVRVQDVLFSDAFDGGLAGWKSVKNLSLDSATFGRSAPSAKATASASPAFAYRNLPQSYPELCMRQAVNLSQQGSNPVTLSRLRTATGASVGQVLVSRYRKLQVRADIPGKLFSSGVSLPTGWSTVEACATVGAAGTWTLYLNGARIGAWTANNGSAGIGRVQIGDNFARTFVVNVDDVMADESFIA